MFLEGGVHTNALRLWVELIKSCSLNFQCFRILLNFQSNTELTKKNDKQIMHSKMTLTLDIVSLAPYLCICPCPVIWTFYNVFRDQNPLSQIHPVHIDHRILWEVLLLWHESHPRAVSAQCPEFLWDRLQYCVPCLHCVGLHNSDTWGDIGRLLHW